MKKNMCLVETQNLWKNEGIHSYRFKTLYKKIISGSVDMSPSYSESIASGGASTSNTTPPFVRYFK
jgi:hypothetical protein